MHIHTYTAHTYLHTYVPTYRHTYIPTYVHTYIPTCMHTCIHTYIDRYKYTYLRICIHTRTRPRDHAYIYMATCVHKNLERGQERSNTSALPPGAGSTRAAQQPIPRGNVFGVGLRVFRDRLPEAVVPCSPRYKTRTRGRCTWKVAETNLDFIAAVCLHHVRHGNRSHAWSMSVSEELCMFFAGWASAY